MDLLWRNDISPDKVTLGTAFYGRAFTATSSKCLTPGCTYSSGADRQPCSSEISVILNSEIVDIIDKTGAKPTLYKDAAVKVLTFDQDQWVAYDDADTLQLKVDFARSQCLGGVMVWAVSHDTRDAQFSKALAKIAGRKYVALEDNSDGYVPLVSTHDQCKWTNCKEGMQLSTSAHSKTRANTFPLRAACPSGWNSVRRTGTGARDGELMIDESGCGGYGFHTFCCPSGAVVPKCGNYTLVICTRRRQLTKGFQAGIPTTTGNATQLALRV
jgi:chitinase